MNKYKVIVLFLINYGIVCMENVPKSFLDTSSSERFQINNDLGKMSIHEVAELLLGPGKDDVSYWPQSIQECCELTGIGIDAEMSNDAINYLLYDPKSDAFAADFESNDIRLRVKRKISVFDEVDNLVEPGENSTDIFEATKDLQLYCDDQEGVKKREKLVLVHYIVAIAVNMFLHLSIRLNYI